MDDHIGKPVTFEVLHECVVRWLGESPTPSPAASSEGCARVDPATLDALAETLGEHTRSEVVKAFVVACDEFEEELSEHVEAGDVEGLTTFMHRLVGSAATVGAGTLADRARAAERVLRSAHRLDAALLEALHLDALRNALVESRAALCLRRAPRAGNEFA